MKKAVKIISIVFSVFCLISGSITGAFAGNVSYDGDSGKFIFIPGEKLSPTDLFEGMNNVMPGDVIYDEIEIRNTGKNASPVKLYLRSHGAKNGDELLSRLVLTVKAESGKELFKAPADEKSTLSDWSYLGTAGAGGSVKLKLTLEVPKELGNSYQNTEGRLLWELKAEEIPENGDYPDTSDTGSIIIYSVLGGTSLVILIFLIYRDRRESF